MNDFDIKSLIRTIPDFPKPGIQFRDITTLLKHPQGLRATIDALAERFSGVAIDHIAGIESRGFIIGAPLAYLLKVGFVPIRKKGKLPGENFGHDYELEYGQDRLEIHTDAVAAGDNVLLVDDLLATGGTAEAAIRLIGMTGAHVVGCAVVVELSELGGRARLAQLGCAVSALCEFEGD